MKWMVVSLSIDEAAQLVTEQVVNGSFSGSVVSDYKLGLMHSGLCRTIIFEQYFMRSSNYASLTVTIDNLSQQTRVSYTASGGSSGMMNFDWGTAESFEYVVECALLPYCIST